MDELPGAGLLLLLQRGRFGLVSSEKPRATALDVWLTFSDVRLANTFLGSLSA